MLDEHGRRGLGKGYQRLYAMAEARTQVRVQSENGLTRIEKPSSSTDQVYPINNLPGLRDSVSIMYASIQIPCTCFLESR